jgi:hypothetical protein
MSKKEMCKTCDFYSLIKGCGHGYCQRYAPRPIMGNPNGNRWRVWALVYENDFCGEHSSKDNVRIPDTISVCPDMEAAFLSLKGS